jgi:SRSO17 transposase
MAPANSATIGQRADAAARADEASAVCGIGGDWGDLDAWLSPFLELLGRSTRRRWAALYIRGLLSPGGSKKVQAIAARLGLPAHDQLHHFISSPAWDDAPLWGMLARQANGLAGGSDAVLAIDAAVLSKTGSLSVGVAAQYCREFRRPINGQALASLTLVGRALATPLRLRLVLPPSWTADPARCAGAGVPEAARMATTNALVALAEIDRLMAAGVRFGCVLADAEFGFDAVLRGGLSARGLLWVAGIPPTQKLCVAGQASRDDKVAEVGSLFPPFGRPQAWHHRPATTQFTTTPVRIPNATGSQRSRIQSGEDVWLVSEQRGTGECKFYLTNLSPSLSLRTLNAALAARAACAEARSRLMQDLGLGAFEGRSWTGLHRHALMGCIAFLYTQQMQTESGRGQRF